MISVARALFPDGDAVESCVGFEPFWEDAELEVVGVVAEARDWRVPAGEQMEGFVSGVPGGSVGARFDHDPPHLQEIHRGSSVPPGNGSGLSNPGSRGTFRTLDSILADSFRDRTFTLGVLGVSALFPFPSRRWGISPGGELHLCHDREIGMILALGAGAGRLRWQVFLGAARPVALGLGAGVGLALASGHRLESLLFQVSPRDSVTLAVPHPWPSSWRHLLAILLPVFRYARRWTRQGRCGG